MKNRALGKGRTGLGEWKPKLCFYVGCPSFSLLYQLKQACCDEYVDSRSVCVANVQSPLWTMLKKCKTSSPAYNRDHQYISPCGTTNSTIALGHTSMVGVMPPAPLVHNTQTLLHSLAVSMATLEASCSPRTIHTSVTYQPQISAPLVPSLPMQWPS